MFTLINTLRSRERMAMDLCWDLGISYRHGKGALLLNHPNSNSRCWLIYDRSFDPVKAASRLAMENLTAELPEIFFFRVAGKSELAKQLKLFLSRDVKSQACLRCDPARLRLLSNSLPFPIMESKRMMRIRNRLTGKYSIVSNALSLHFFSYSLGARSKVTVELSRDKDGNISITTIDYDNRLHPTEVVLCVDHIANTFSGLSNTIVLLDPYVLSPDSAWIMSWRKVDEVVGSLRVKYRSPLIAGGTNFTHSIRNLLKENEEIKDESVNYPNFASVQH